MRVHPQQFRHVMPCGQLLPFAKNSVLDMNCFTTSRTSEYLVVNQILWFVSMLNFSTICNKFIHLHCILSFDRFCDSSFHISHLSITNLASSGCITQLSPIS